MKKNIYVSTLLLAALVLSSCSSKLKPLTSSGGAQMPMPDYGVPPLEKIAEANPYCEVITGSALRLAQIDVYFSASGEQLSFVDVSPTITANFPNAQIVSIKDNIAEGISNLDALPSSLPEFSFRINSPFGTQTELLHEIVFTVKNSTVSAVCTAQYLLKKKVIGSSTPFVLLDGNGLPDSIIVNSGKAFNLSWTISNATHCKLFEYAKGTALSSSEINALVLNTSDDQSISVNTTGETTNTVRKTYTAPGKANYLVCENRNVTAPFPRAFSRFETVVLTPEETSNSNDAPYEIIESGSVIYGTVTSTSRISVPYGATVSLSWKANSKAQCYLRKNYLATSTLISNAFAATNFPVGNFNAGTTNLKLTCEISGSPPESKDIYVDVAEPLDHLLMITTDTTPGAFTEGENTSISAADAICMRNAVEKNLRADRPWRAVVAASSYPARTRIVLFGRVYSEGRQIGDSSGAFFTGNDWINSVAPTFSGKIWTGLALNGTPGGYDCQGWTSSASGKSGRVGNPQATDKNRFDSGPADGCNSQNHLLCISQ